MQATQEGYKDVVRSCKEKIRKAKAQIEVNLSTAGKDNSFFYKYMISQRRAKGDCPSLLGFEGEIQ